MEAALHHHHGTVIKEARQAAQMTQEQVAEVWPKADGGVGVSSRYVQDVEYGKRRIESAYTLRELAKLLSIPLWKFGLSEYDPFDPQTPLKHGKSMHSVAIPSHDLVLPAHTSIGTTAGSNESSTFTWLTAQQLEPQDMDSCRRHFLEAFGVLGVEVLMSPQHYPLLVERHSSGLSAPSIANLASITQQFRAMQRRGDTFIASGVNAHVTTLQAALESTVDDTTRRELWRILALAQLVAGFNPLKKTQLVQAKTLHEAAIASAQMSGDPLLVGATLGHLAHFHLRKEQDTQKAAQLLDRAGEFTRGYEPLNGWFALVKASIAAKEGHRQHCEAYLTDAMTIAHHLRQTPEHTDVYFTDFSLMSAHVFTVNCWLAIRDAKKAQKHFTDEVNLEELSDNRRASAFCDASKASALVGELALAQNYAFQAIDKALSTQQYYVISRCITLAHMIQKKEPHEPHAAAIAEYAHEALAQM
jgi:transcriptional regulator with XRE-family HTH domain